MTITVACPSCNTSFPIDPMKVPEEGVRARCSSCSAVFEVNRPTEEVAAEPLAPTPSVAEVTAPVDPSEMEVPPEVRSPLGDAPVVVSDVAEEAPDVFGGREVSFDFGETPVEVPAPEATPSLEMEEAPSLEVEEAPAVEVDEAEPEEAPSTGPIRFGRRSPEDKAKSLARSLVSDLVAYHGDKHTEALASGTLVQVFEEEIGKSWKEYQEQVDPEILEQGTFFNDALNEILAKGENVFSIEG